jgi:3-deoxy-manno-octulosonate cytidylyltransferase (CMP-KDO synthetase)
MAEGLEQLRWLDNGYVIGVGITTDVGVGIDTPEDLCRAEEIISNFK